MSPEETYRLPGVSGSTIHFSSSVGHPSLVDSGSTNTRIFGSDFSPQLEYESGHVRGAMAGVTNTFTAASTGRLCKNVPQSV